MNFFIKLFINFYRNFISPLLGKNCRFYPTCSEYALIALEKYGVVFGIIKTILRIARCHPFNSGGVDFP
ncbi:MAG: membrane protein insertion efficiency factor YidD [Endomicrobiia bacterium]